jgi:membrane-bound lytic murein transglycosylase
METTLQLGKRLVTDDGSLHEIAKRAIVVIRGGSADRIVSPNKSFVLFRRSNVVLPAVKCPIIDTRSIADDDEHDEKLLAVLRQQVDDAQEVNVERLIRDLKALGATITRPA